jgi:hypothetical protein
MGLNAIGVTRGSARRIFLLQYQDRGRIPEVRRQVVDMAINAINSSGIRDTARVLRISPTTVLAVLNKEPPRCNMPTPYSSTLFVHAPAPPAFYCFAPRR